MNYNLDKSVFDVYQKIYKFIIQLLESCNIKSKSDSITLKLQLTKKRPEE